MKKLRKVTVERGWEARPTSEAQYSLAVEKIHGLIPGVRDNRHVFITPAGRKALAQAKKGRFCA